jgi:hypothetical protein
MVAALENSSRHGLGIPFHHSRSGILFSIMMAVLYTAAEFWHTALYRRILNQRCLLPPRNGVLRRFVSLTVEHQRKRKNRVPKFTHKLSHLPATLYWDLQMKQPQCTHYLYELRDLQNRLREFIRHLSLGRVRIVHVWCGVVSIPDYQRLVRRLAAWLRFRLDCKQQFKDRD